MITCKFRNGRLGEVMFMTYGLFYFCIRNNIPLNQIVIDKNYLGEDFYHLNKNYIIKENFPIFDNIKNVFIDNFDEVFKNPVDIDKKYSQFYSSEYFQYDKTKNYILKDYWIMPMCFKLFRSLFRSKDLVNQLKKRYKDIDFNKSCSVHVRLGDFKLIQQSDDLKSRYSVKIPNSFQDIKRQIDQLCKEHDIDNILVFSDDIEECKKNLNSKNVIYIENNEPYEDMTLMSLCKYNILNKGSYFSYCAMFMK